MTFGIATNHPPERQAQNPWTKDRDYLAPPTLGKLAELDPALIVT
jgi:hypothetical protein